MRGGRRGGAAPVDPTTAWAQAAVRGDFVVGDLVRHAAERHLRDLRDARARGYHWRPELAQRVLDFFPSLFTITDGPAVGKPFHLLPYQVFIAGSLMGWVTAEARWRFRSAWIETGKGQAKSPLMAGLGLYAMGWCDFPRAQVYSIAANKQTANFLFLTGKAAEKPQKSATFSPLWRAFSLSGGWMGADGENRRNPPPDGAARRRRDAWSDA